jgi:hypothetical protein
MYHQSTNLLVSGHDDLHDVLIEFSIDRKLNPLGHSRLVTYTRDGGLLLAIFHEPIPTPVGTHPARWEVYYHVVPQPEPPLASLRRIARELDAIEALTMLPPNPVATIAALVTTGIPQGNSQRAGVR